MTPPSNEADKIRKDIGNEFWLNEDKLNPQLWIGTISAQIKLTLLGQNYSATVINNNYNRLWGPVKKEEAVLLYINQVFENGGSADFKCTFPGNSNNPPNLLLGLKKEGSDGFMLLSDSHEIKLSYPKGYYATEKDSSSIGLWSIDNNNVTLNFLTGSLKLQFGQTTPPPTLINTNWIQPNKEFATGLWVI